MIRKRGLLPPHQGWDHPPLPVLRFSGGLCLFWEWDDYLGEDRAERLFPEPRVARAPGCVIGVGFIVELCLFGAVSPSGPHPSAAVPVFTVVLTDTGVPVDMCCYLRSLPGREAQGRSSPVYLIFFEAHPASLSIEC